MQQPYVGEDQNVRGQLRPRRLDVLRGAAASISENETLLVDRHDLRRRRREHFRAAGRGGGCRFTRATASSWPRPAGPRKITLTISQIPAHSHTYLASKQRGDAGGPRRQRGERVADR